ncbi:hypothetical protein K1719_011155 [Acacia pycnantha]|nr:hypothetical protein K1719_011155 [Acacia pycnantha]
MATAMVENSDYEDDQLASMTTDDVVRASRLLDKEIRILKGKGDGLRVDRGGLHEMMRRGITIMEMNPED